MSVALVAIAKNEARFVLEWIAHNLAVGFDDVIIYDHNSVDGMEERIASAGKIFPVRSTPWSPSEDLSPQKAAYAHAIETLSHDWLAFFDLDEFLVLSEKVPSISEYLDTIPNDVGAIAVNWLTLGSGGRADRDYDLVTQTFRTGGKRNWGNNNHIKTIARRDAIASMGIHDCILHSGRYVHPNGSTLQMPTKRGISAEVDHSLMQLNHYQTKSRADWAEKMARGRAGKSSNDPTRKRDNPDGFFKRLDKNEVEYCEIDRHYKDFKKKYEAILKSIRPV